MLLRRVQLLVFRVLVVSGCFRVGNLGLDFEIRIPDFKIKHEIRKWILLHGNLSARWISLKKSILGFYQFALFFLFWKSKKELINKMVIVSIGLYIVF